MSNKKKGGSRHSSRGQGKSPGGSRELSSEVMVGVMLERTSKDCMVTGVVTEEVTKQGNCKVFGGTELIDEVLED